jgi:hypothetical protein
VPVGAIVRFRPNPAKSVTVDAECVGHRRDPHDQRSRPGVGWVDTRDAAGFFRSVRASVCTIIRQPDPEKVDRPAKMPAWISQTETFDATGVFGQAWDAAGTGGWVTFNTGDKAITLDGEFTADQLRDLAAMIDANRREG